MDNKSIIISFTIFVVIVLCISESNARPQFFSSTYDNITPVSYWKSPNGSVLQQLLFALLTFSSFYFCFACFS